MPAEVVHESRSEVPGSTVALPAANPAVATPVVSAVVVSFNTRQMTLDCLRILLNDLGDLTAEVFVVDNGSTDGSVEAIRGQFPSVQVIANPHNAGFGAANNQAMNLATGEFILLINTDAFPEPGAISAMLEYLRRNPKAGVVGPRLLNADGSLQRSCFRFPSPLRCWMENLWVYSAVRNHPRISDYSYWPHDVERNVDFVIGACLIVRRDVLKQVGVFDPAFFMYSEEIDWQRRIRSAGWEVAFTPAARVKHLGGASGAGEKSRIKRHFFDSLDVYELKHHGLAGLVSMRLAMLVGCSLRALLWGAAYVASPARRSVAAQKASLHLWLCRRQLTRWRVSAGGNLPVSSME